MELTFRDRKRIINGAVPKLADGLGLLPSSITYNVLNGNLTPQSYNTLSFNPANMFSTSSLKTEPLSPHKLIEQNGGFNNAAKTAIGQGSINPTISSGAKSIANGTSNAMGAIQAAPAVVNAVGSIVNANRYDKTYNDILQDNGTMTKNAGGIGYEYLNDPDYQRELDEVRRLNKSNTLKTMGSGAAAGAAIGSLAGPVGGVVGGAIGGVVGLVGGIFGGKSRKRKAMEALNQAEATARARNMMNRDAALTLKIREDNASQIGSSFSPYVYNFENGKQPNAMVSNGEIIGHMDEFGNIIDALRVGRGKDNKDTIPVHLKDGVEPVSANSFVISNKNGLSDFAWETGDIKGALQMQANMKKYNKGKLPKFATGWDSFIPHMIGVTASLGQYFDAKGLDIYRPNTYHANPYEQDALAALSELRNNPYPTLTQLREAEARTNAAINQSGGLSAGQRWLSRAATLNNTLQNMAKWIADVQNRNTALTLAFRTALLNAGVNSATRKDATSQFDTQMYNAAHGARQQGMQMGLRNLVDQINSYYADRFKYNQFNDMLGLYRDQQQLDRDRLDADLKRYGSNNNIINPYKKVYIPSTAALSPHSNNNWDSNPVLKRAKSVKLQLR